MNRSGIVFICNFNFLIENNISGVNLLFEKKIDINSLFGKEDFTRGF